MGKDKEIAESEIGGLEYGAREKLGGEREKDRRTGRRGERGWLEALLQPLILTV